MAKNEEEIIFTKEMRVRNLVMSCLQHIYDNEGIRIDGLSTDWIDSSSPNGNHVTLRSVRIDSIMTQ